MTNGELEQFVHQDIVVHLQSGESVSGVLRYADAHVIEATRKTGSIVAYDVVSERPAGRLQHYLVHADLVDRVEVGGLSRAEASERMFRLHTASETRRLHIQGFRSPAGNWLANFSTGVIMIEPNPHAGQPAHTRFRLWYTSWDGTRRRDVTDMNYDDVIVFLRGEQFGELR